MYADSFSSLNKGKDTGMGWKFDPMYDGKPIVSGRAPANQVVFGDIDGCVLPRAP